MSKSNTTASDPEVEMLRVNIKDQLNRLFDQLEDLDELREELTEQEYDEEKAETIESLQEMQNLLETSFSSNMSLATEFTPAQEAIKRALAEMNNTNSNKDNKKGGSTAKFRLLTETSASLRQKLVELDRNLKLRLITQESFNRQAGDIVLTLQSLGEKLNSEEENILAQFGARHTMLTTTNDPSSPTQNILASASTAVNQAQQQ